MDARAVAGVLVIGETELGVVTSAVAAEEVVVDSAIVAFGMYAVVTSGNNERDRDETSNQVADQGRLISSKIDKQSDTLAGDFYRNRRVSVTAMISLSF